MHIVIVTIDHQPRRNAMTRQMMAELATVWDRLEHSRARCIILTSRGALEGERQQVTVLFANLMGSMVMCRGARDCRGAKSVVLAPVLRTASYPRQFGEGEVSVVTCASVL